MFVILNSRSHQHIGINRNFHLARAQPRDVILFISSMVRIGPFFREIHPMKSDIEPLFAAALAARHLTFDDVKQAGLDRDALRRQRRHRFAGFDVRLFLEQIPDGLGLVHFAFLFLRHAISPEGEASDR